MKKLFTVFVCIGLVTAVSATRLYTTPLPISCTTLTGSDSTPVAPTYHYRVFKQANNSFGYDIFSGSKKIIHQETIPGQPGNNGFTTAAAATKVATLVVSKLQKNNWPPVVSTEELKQLHAL